MLEKNLTPLYFRKKFFHQRFWDSQPLPPPQANGWLLNRLFRAISQLHVFSDLIGSFGLKDVLLLVRCCTYVGFGLTVLT